MKSGTLQDLATMAQRVRASVEVMKDHRRDLARLVADADRSGRTEAEIVKATGYSLSSVRRWIMDGADEIDSEQGR